MKKYPALFILISFLLILNSCIGISMDIQMNKDGSGKIVMEYRVSQMLQNIGAFDGNESMPSVPISREDWRKTVDSISGFKLASYSSKKDKQDTIVNVTLEFKEEEALLAFLSPIGEKVTIKRTGASGTLEIILLDEPVPLNEEDINLSKMLMDGYKFSIGFKAPGNSVLAITDGSGNSSPAPASSEAVLSGKNVMFSIAMADLFELKNGLGLRFIW